ncbi:MAG TPA: PH domain-containing protein, partial [Thermoanaerobaculia bacterium]|nr:PH domain-containing protein [Thermoanaerobaculia bacterium]
MAAEPGLDRSSGAEAAPVETPPEPLLLGEDAAAPSVTPIPRISVADGVERQLDPRWVTLRRTLGWIRAGVIGLGSIVPLGSIVLFASFPGGVDALLVLVWAGLVLFLIWSAWRWPAIEHRHASYRVDAERIEIRRGIFWRKVIDVPRSRVQHTDVSQGPLERGYGLGTLVVYTAGTAHAKVELPGLDHGLALAIRD